VTRFAAFAAGAALFGLGWIVGRSSTTTDETSEATTTTVAPPSRPVGLTATTAGAGAWELTSIPLPERARELGLRVVAIDAAGSVTDIDAVDGAQALWTGGESDLGELIVGADWTIVTSRSTGRVTVFAGFGTGDSAAFGDMPALHREPFADRLWRIPDREFPDDVIVAEEVGIDGTPTGVTMNVGPYPPTAADPRGGLLVTRAPGGAYHVDEVGPSRLTTGSLLAIGSARALALECSQHLVACDPIVIDRDTGHRQRLQVVDDVGATAPTVDAWNVGSSGEVVAISPDSRWAPVVVRETSGSVAALVDVRDGSLRRVADAVVDGPIAWTQDSATFLFLRRDGIAAYDVATGSVELVVPGEYSTFASRP
ncbi:MAG: hypothetical protein R2705_10210, partial [Ilumatobacteraceae bacterium]